MWGGRKPVMYEIQTYLGADGLMHCTVCKEPVEAFYPKGSLLEMRGSVRVKGRHMQKRHNIIKKKSIGS